MSILVENNLIKNENEDIFEQKSHYIPCKIEQDGSANVKKYFDPYIVENKSQGKYTYFCVFVEKKSLFLRKT